MDVDPVAPPFVVAEARVTPREADELRGAEAAIELHRFLAQKPNGAALFGEVCEIAFDRFEERRIADRGLCVVEAVEPELGDAVEIRERQLRDRGTRDR